MHARCGEVLVSRVCRAVSAVWRPRGRSGCQFARVAAEEAAQAAEGEAARAAAEEEVAHVRRQGARASSC